MMQPYMGVYGITKILLEQPCNLELQIYWETHGFLRLESKQWGWSMEGKALNIPLSAKILTVVGMHEGKSKQVVTYDWTNSSWIGTDQINAILYIALCH